MPLATVIDDRDFDTDRNTGVIRDGNGNPTTLVYDDRGNVLTETDPLGNVIIPRVQRSRQPRSGNADHRSSWDDNGPQLRRSRKPADDHRAWHADRSA